MTSKLATTDGKEAALAALTYRRANKPKPIDNGSLHAGSPMYFYCLACAHLADVKPESFTTRPKSLCAECDALKQLGWLE